MIGNIVYALKWTLDHPLQALAFTLPFGLTTYTPIANLRFALTRSAIYMAGRMLMDGGTQGKMFFEDLTRPKGAPKPPLYRGSELQRAVQAGKGKARAPLARTGTRLAPYTRPLLAAGAAFITSPVGFYTTVAASTVVAGIAVGRTDGVRTAPPTNQRFVMGAPM